MNSIGVEVCKECGIEFILSEKDINFFKGNGLQLPKRCWQCRNERRNDNRIKDLNKHIGKFITRTKAEWTGDRSFVGSKIELVNIGEDGSIYYRYPKGTFFYKEEPEKLRPESNDGYWKVVE